MVGERLLERRPAVLDPAIGLGTDALDPSLYQVFTRLTSSSACLLSSAASAAARPTIFSTWAVSSAPTPDSIRSMFAIRCDLHRSGDLGLERGE